MSLKEKLVKVAPYKYIFPKKGKMNVDAWFYVNDALLPTLDEVAVQQAINVATLPGIVKAAIAMSDVHMGYGFPIGGVAAFDFENGIISPGGIGFDINCGVRLLKTPFHVDEIKKDIVDLTNKIFDLVPSGVGEGGFIKLTNSELDEVLEKGARWAIEQGYGSVKDLERIESNGMLKEANANNVTSKAKKRGRNQLGTLGSGNHFLEIQYVEKIFDEEAAKAFGLKQGQVVVMIHTGSRGLGHQTCADYIRLFEESFPHIFSSLPDKDLVYGPLNTRQAEKYIGAMSAAANFAWANRQIITHRVREAFNSFYGETNIELLYDVAHNIAKIEVHEVDGEKRKLIVHRKGATRAFPPGNKEIPEIYRSVGQPVIIPGSMGTASYVLVGQETSMKESFGSTCHGSGRVLSRRQAFKEFKGEKVKKELLERGIYVKSATVRGIAEEVPEAYKNVDDVVKVMQDAGISKIVARLKPLGVIKG